MTTNAADQRQHRKNRRAKGLCGVNGCHVRTGDVSYYCAVHAADHASRMKLLRQKARAKAA